MTGPAHGGFGACPGSAPAAAEGGRARAEGRCSPTITAHVTILGDVLPSPDGWAGKLESGLHMEGFTIRLDGLPPTLRFSYQIVTPEGVASEWFRPGQFCGARGMNRPVYGFRLRLDDASAALFDAAYVATFTDGSEAGPVSAPLLICASSGAPIEAFRVDFRPVGGSRP